MSARDRLTAGAVLSRRVLEQLGALQSSVQELGTQRAAALRLLVTSRHAATVTTQREFWFEFVWADQEYRMAVRRLAQFCELHRDGTARGWTPGRLGKL